MPTADGPSAQPSCQAFFCLPADRENAGGSGRRAYYGVCTLIREDFHDAFVERVREVEWDREGRFLVCETKAVGSVPRLAIFNIYAVNGTDEPYRDPQTGEIAGTGPDRKRHVHSLLRAECRALEAQGRQVIIAGDLNVVRTLLHGFSHLRILPEQHCVNRADLEARFLKDDDTDCSETASNPPPSYHHRHRMSLPPCA